MNQRESYQLGTIVETKASFFLRYREYDLHGTPIHRSEKIGSKKQYPTRAKAEKAAEDIRKRINQPRPVVTFKELADQFVKDVLPTVRAHSRASYRGKLKYLRDQYDHRRLDEITPGELDLWLNSVKHRKTGKELAKGTRRNIRNMAHNMWRHAMLWGYLNPQINPVSIVRVTKGAREKVRSVTIDAEIYRKLLADPELIPVVKMMVQHAMMTGMGVSEILGCRWEDSIDFNKMVIHVLRSVDGKDVNETKNEFRQNDVPMPKELADALKQWRKAEPSWGGWVYGSPQTERPYWQNSLQTFHLKPAGKRAGCPGIGWHSFRHTFSAEMDLSGASDRVQQRAMRHGNPAQTKHYGKQSPALFEAARKAQDVVVGKFKTGTEE